MAIECFMEVTDVKGESLVKDFEDQIDVLAWNWGLSQSGTSHMGGGSGAGRVSVQDMSFTKFTDSATHSLMRACCNGHHFPMATLTARKAGKDPLTYLVIKMEQVMVTNVSTGGSPSDERQTENVSLNFSKVTVDYTPQDAKGAGGAKKTMKYDIAKNVAE